MELKRFLIILNLIILIIVDQVNATTLQDTSVNKLINTYIHAFMYNNPKELNSVLDNMAFMKIPRFNRIILQSKDELIRQAKLNVGINEASSSNLTILSSSKSLVIAKVIFTFNGFYEAVFVLAEFHSKRWSITELIKTFPYE